MAVLKVAPAPRSRPGRPAEPKNSPLFNTSLAKGLAVLEAFDAQRRSLNLPQIAATAGISKGAAQRLTYTLEILGFLRKDPVSKRYSPSPRFVEFGRRYVGGSALIETSVPYLRDLNIRCGETVNLSEPDGTDMVFVATFPGLKQLAVQLPAGSRFPMFCTASGRAYLAGLDEAVADALIDDSVIVRYTPLTVMEPQAIRSMIREARSAGYAYAEGEFYRGDINVAAPVLGVGGVAVAAVSLSVPVTRWSLADVHRDLAPQIAQAARAISAPIAPRPSATA